MIKFGKVIYRNIQEQVAKNTEDIAKIFRRPVLQVKMVEELPEEGEEGILYLLPATDPEIGNYYEEYLWIDSAWELIGSSSVDISNMVTTDTEQTITGAKTINNELIFSNGTAWLKITSNGWTSTIQQQAGVGLNFGGASLTPTADGSKDFGSSTMRWKDIYLGGKIDLNASNSTTITTNASSELVVDRNGTTIFNFGNTNGQAQCYYTLAPISTGVPDLGASSKRWKDLHLAGISYFYGANYNGSITNKDNRMVIAYGNADRLRVGNADSDFATNLSPKTNAVFNLGSSSAKWKDLYLAGNLTDGTNSVTIADLAALITYAKAQGWIS